LEEWMAKKALTVAERDAIAEQLDLLFRQVSEVGADKLWPEQPDEYRKAILLLTGKTPEDFREEVGRRESAKWTRAEMKRRGERRFA
jgi:hypothetical protein